MRITSLSRDKGAIGDEVIIRGDGLGVGTRGSVTFNGVAAVFTETNGEITTHVPAGAVTGPLTVAGGGDKAETQFTVNVIPHGKERTYQAIETGDQTIHRDRIPTAQPPLPSANPEATDHELPGVPVEGGDSGGGQNKEEREKEATARPIHPPAPGQPVMVPPDAKPGQMVADVVVSGPTPVAPAAAALPAGARPATEATNVTAPGQPVPAAAPGTAGAKNPAAAPAPAPAGSAPAAPTPAPIGGSNPTSAPPAPDANKSATADSKLYPK